MIETTDFRKAEQYTLSIRLTADGFCFSLFNPLATEEEAFSYEMAEADELLSECGNLKKLFRQKEWLNNPFGKVCIITESTRQLIVPLALFDDEQAEALFYHSMSEGENEVVCYNILPHENMVVIFGMDESTHDWLLEKYPNVKFYAKATPLISHFSADAKAEDAKKLFVNFGKEVATLLAYENGELQLCNSTSFTNPTDIVYHILSCWKSLDMNQETDELYLTGTPVEQEELLHILRTYVQQVKVVEHTECTDLYSLSSCE